ncbi:Wzz/FepE/Etk N-terminal domain-containing protein [Kangiella sediminilitoris]|uniref:Lipopolysaccharide biosynthesis protein n=1 Tax=Kangiella sediminilitoris TaxID=1144748 RepID=A0A1B3BBK2_9GAMM|nr:Wzz/FepE/Etk N-terminal domain-containing protein [Kangiella sediminilitoris]AOE50169.1 Lipopolysaccharide biosynthesis protein [Kangiella sediminilitoris]
MNNENDKEQIVRNEPTTFHQPEHQTGKEDELDIRELFSIIWKGKWIIIAVTFVFAVASVGIALYLPNEYKATAVVQPNESAGGGKLSQLAGQFGGLASLAGISLGTGESSDAVIAMEVMKSWGFTESFINNHNLDVPLFAAEEWSQLKNKLVIDEDLYDIQQQKWVREAPQGKTVEPTSWELYEKFKERIAVTQDKETGLVNISVTHYSPIIAQQWAKWLVEDINRHMKERALKEANESIKYLEEQIKKTSVAEIRAVFSELIQEQHKTKMLAQVSDEYIFKTVSSAKVPEEKVKPKRLLIVILGTLLGGFLSVLLALVIGFVNNKK